MKKESKIKALRAIQQGILLPEDMLTNDSPIFIQNEDLSGWKEGFKGEYTEYTNEEFEILKAKIMASSERREAAGLGPVKMILFVLQQGCEPIKDNP